MSAPEEFTDRWAATRVGVTSPNGMVRVTLHGDDRVEVALEPGWAERTPVWELCEQVGRAARLTFAARTQAFFALRSEHSGRVVRPSRRPANARAAAYREEMSRLVVEGRSADGAVRVAAVGMTQFAVTVDPLAHGRLGTGGLSRALTEAATALLREQLRQGSEVRERVYADPEALDRAARAAPVPHPVAAARPRPRRTTRADDRRAAPARRVPDSWLAVGWRPSPG